MPAFKFKYPIQVRYSDIDAQGHVNNAHFISYIEQSRFAYLVQLKLWDGVSFIDLGLIVADVHMSYLGQIYLGQGIHVVVRVSRIGNKSLIFEYEIRDDQTEAALARAETVMVAYDYHSHKSILVPDEWRAKITAFEEV